MMIRIIIAILLILLIVWRKRARRESTATLSTRWRTEDLPRHESEQSNRM